MLLNSKDWMPFQWNCPLNQNWLLIGWWATMLLGTAIATNNLIQTE
jgi:hypothetical protein